MQRVGTASCHESEIFVNPNVSLFRVLRDVKERFLTGRLGVQQSVEPFRYLRRRKVDVVEDSAASVFDGVDKRSVRPSNELCV